MLVQCILTPQSSPPPSHYPTAPAPSYPQVSPGKTPQVVGALLDAEAAEEFITNLILSVRSLLPVDKVRRELDSGEPGQGRTLGEVR